MLEIQIDISGDTADSVEQDIRRSEDAAVRDVMQRIVMPQMVAALSYSGKDPAPIGRLGVRTGELRGQLAARFFVARNGLTQATLSVRGERSSAAAANEAGSRHGLSGTPLPARRMFTIVGGSLHSTMESTAVREIESGMRQKGYS